MNSHAPHNLPTQSSEIAQKPPFLVFAATAIVVFFCTLSVADSVGFVPDYIDGTTPITADMTTSDSGRDVALSNLPQLGDTTNSLDTNTNAAGNQSLVIPVSPDAAPTSGVGSLIVTSGQSSQTPNAQTVNSQTAQPASAQVGAAVQGSNPVRIIIDSVGIDLPVQNPATRDVDALDALLQTGPARYSASAQLGEDGNVVLFAHSSHLPIVHNQMFRAFNKIPDLKAGDSITLVGSNGKKYLYRVTGVEKASTTDGTTIDLSTAHGKKLTLVTCDTLTGKSARFVLSADFVGVM
ncbi:MAG: Peptidase sortase-like protein [Candidatus Kaiserbacteria bacterium]|nr:Peptidase sortase-like protein [Candidatus Kaiserbacteria bacterium]